MIVSGRRMWNRSFLGWVACNPASICCRFVAEEVSVTRNIKRFRKERKVVESTDEGRWRHVGVCWGRIVASWGWCVGQLVPCRCIQALLPSTWRWFWLVSVSLFTLPALSLVSLQFLKFTFCFQRVWELKRSVSLQSWSLPSCASVDDAFWLLVFCVLFMYLFVVTCFVCCCLLCFSFFFLLFGFVCSAACAKAKDSTLLGPQSLWFVCRTPFKCAAESSAMWRWFRLRGWFPGHRFF